MRILFISAFYPPCEIGGWEQLAQDIDCGLQLRGHTTHVLTSAYGLEAGCRSDEHVTRALELENDQVHYQPFSFFLQRKKKHQRNLVTLKKILDEFRPDIIFVHGMWNLWRGVPWFAEQSLPGRVVFYVADNWPSELSVDESYWRSETSHKLLNRAKKIIAALPLKSLAEEKKRIALRFQHVICVSETVRTRLDQNLHLPSENLQVIHNGVEIELFSPSKTQLEGEKKGQGLSLMYAGSLIPTKGVHTAIEAMILLAQHSEFDEINLTIVGSGHPDYENRLHQMVEQNDLARRVIFEPHVPRQEIPQVLSQHDVLLFPSVGEALPRMVEEAMAAGLVVIGTTAGGTGEILFEGETGLTFAVGDGNTLAQQIMRLYQDPELFRRLVHNGSQLIQQQFSFQKTVDEIEHYFMNIVENEPRP